MELSFYKEFIMYHSRTAYYGQNNHLADEIANVLSPEALTEHYHNYIKSLTNQISKSFIKDSHNTQNDYATSKRLVNELFYAHESYKSHRHFSKSDLNEDLFKKDSEYYAELFIFFHEMNLIKSYINLGKSIESQKSFFNHFNTCLQHFKSVSYINYEDFIHNTVSSAIEKNRLDIIETFMNNPELKKVMVKPRPYYNNLPKWLISEVVMNNNLEMFELLLKSGLEFSEHQAAGIHIEEKKVDDRNKESFALVYNDDEGFANLSNSPYFFPELENYYKDKEEHKDKKGMFNGKLFLISEAVDYIKNVNNKPSAYEIISAILLSKKNIKSFINVLSENGFGISAKLKRNIISYVANDPIILSEPLFKEWITNPKATDLHKILLKNMQFNETLYTDAYKSAKDLSLSFATQFALKHKEELIPLFNNIHKKHQSDFFNRCFNVHLKKISSTNTQSKNFTALKMILQTLDFCDLISEKFHLEIDRKSVITKYSKEFEAIQNYVQNFKTNKDNIEDEKFILHYSLLTGTKTQKWANDDSSAFKSLPKKRL